jgi:hypothetical protein
MEGLFSLLFLASLTLLIIGLGNPVKSLFWDKQERTKKRSNVIYGSLTLLFFILFGMAKNTQKVEQPQFEKTNSETKKEPSYQQPYVEKPNPLIDSLNSVREALEQKRADEDATVIQKLKAIAKRDWPNDYSTQEYWINQEIEDYRYMQTIPNDAIKRQAQRDWPFDFTTQKYWYNEQIAAKERLGN